MLRPGAAKGGRRTFGWWLDKEIWGQNGVADGGEQKPLSGHKGITIKIITMANIIQPLSFFTYTTYKYAHIPIASVIILSAPGYYFCCQTQPG